MKGLLDLDGKKLLDLSHFIRFNKRDSIIGAYVCKSAQWIYLNFEGDTLSYGNGYYNRLPELKNDLNKTRAFLKDGELHRKGDQLFGYLDKKANWKIPPQFQEAHDFKGNFTLVKLNNFWGVIDKNGKFIIPPIFKSDSFELPSKSKKE